MLTQSGNITILVYLEPPNPVLFELWPNLNLGGTTWDSYWYPNISNTWTSGYITSTYIVNISGRFTTYLIPPVDDTYTIYFYHDNGGRTYFEGTKKTENWQEVVETESFTATMKAGQLYQMIAELNDSGGAAEAYLYWSYTSQSKTVIPRSNFKYLQYVKNVPMTLQVYPFKNDVSLQLMKNQIVL